MFTFQDKFIISGKLGMSAARLSAMIEGLRETNMANAKIARLTDEAISELLRRDTLSSFVPAH